MAPDISVDIENEGGEKPAFVVPERPAAGKFEQWANMPLPTAAAHVGYFKINAGCDCQVAIKILCKDKGIGISGHDSKVDKRYFGEVYGVVEKKRIVLQHVNRVALQLFPQEISSKQEGAGALFLNLCVDKRRLVRKPFVVIVVQNIEAGIHHP